MQPQRRLAGALEVAARAAEGVLGAVLYLNVRFQVALHGAAVLAKVTLVGFFARVNPDVPLQVGVDFELGIALLALERSVPLRGNGRTREERKKNTQNKCQCSHGMQHRPAVEAQCWGLVTTHRCVSGGAR